LRSSPTCPSASEGDGGKQLHQDMTTNPSPVPAPTTVCHQRPPLSTIPVRRTIGSSTHHHRRCPPWTTTHTTPHHPCPPPPCQPPAHPHDQHHFKSGTIPPPREKPPMPCVPMPSAMDAAACARRSAHRPQGGSPCQPTLPPPLPFGSPGPPHISGACTPH
jgi:hypothetical protein